MLSYERKMVSPDQSVPDLADKETRTREKLILWDRSTEPSAPLTDKQTDSVLELRSAAETLPIPSEASRLTRAVSQITPYSTR